MTLLHHRWIHQAAKHRAGAGGQPALGRGDWRPNHHLKTPQPVTTYPTWLITASFMLIFITY